MSETLKSGGQYEGWKDETSEYAESLQTFLAKAATPNFDLDRAEAVHYSSEELHFSGTSPRFQDVQRGTDLPSSVRVLYRDGRPTHVHAYYQHDERGGQNLDVYLSKKALEDFLKTE